MDDPEVVLFKQLVHSFADALFTTIHEARRPTQDESRMILRRHKVYERWDVFADRLVEFANVEGK